MVATAFGIIRNQCQLCKCFDIVTGEDKGVVWSVEQ